MYSACRMKAVVAIERERLIRFKKSLNNFVAVVMQNDVCPRMMDARVST
jgi:hypothetical protein